MNASLVSLLLRIFFHFNIIPISGYCKQADNPFFFCRIRISSPLLLHNFSELESCRRNALWILKEMCWWWWLLLLCVFQEVVCSLMQELCSGGGVGEGGCFLMFTIGKALECGSLNRSVSKLTLLSLLIWKKVMVFFTFIESQTHNIALSQVCWFLPEIPTCSVCVYKQVTYLWLLAWVWSY